MTLPGSQPWAAANKKLDLARWTQYLLPAEEIIAVLDQ